MIAPSSSHGTPLECIDELSFVSIDIGLLCSAEIYISELCRH